jgi:hypothetical protein
MNSYALGLYGLRSWYADRLAPVRQFLVSRRVPRRAGRENRTLPDPGAAGRHRVAGGVALRPGDRIGADRARPAGQDRRTGTRPDGGPAMSAALSPAAATALCLAIGLVVGGLGVLASRNAELLRRWRTWAVAAVRRLPGPPPRRWRRRPGWGRPIPRGRAGRHRLRRGHEVAGRAAGGVSSRRGAARRDRGRPARAGRNHRDPRGAATIRSRAPRTGACRLRRSHPGRGPQR